MAERDNKGSDQGQGRTPKPTEPTTPGASVLDGGGGVSSGGGGTLVKPEKPVSAAQPPDSEQEVATTVEQPELPKPDPALGQEGWMKQLGDDTVIRQEKKQLWWDTVKREYTWEDADHKMHTGKHRPPDDQIKDAPEDDD
jgi:hypothetical protein